MLARLAKWIVFAMTSNFTLAATAALPNPWNDDLVGSCYPALVEYMTAAFGNEYANDENIKIIPLENVGTQLHGLHYVWVGDFTPTQNYSQVLFRIDANGKSCAVLLALASTNVSLEQTINGVLPKYVTTEETVPAGPAARVVYKLDNATQNYYPARCYKVEKGISSDKVKKVPCKNVFK